MITDNIPNSTLKNLENSIELGNKEAFKALRSFLRKVSTLSIRTNSISDFRDYVKIYPRLYQKSQTIIGSPQTNTQKLAITHSYQDLRDLIYFDIGYSFEPYGKIEIETVENANKFYYECFTSLNSLLYQIVRHNDTLTLESTIAHINTLEDHFAEQSFRYSALLSHIKNNPSSKTAQENDEAQVELNLSITKKFATYKRHSILAITAWVYSLYDKKLIPETLTNEFISILSKGTYRPDLLSDLLFLGSSDSNLNLHEYLKWGSWDYTERITLAGYSRETTSDWFLKGLYVSLISDNSNSSPIPTLQNLNLKELKILSRIYKNLLSFRDEILKNHEHWAKLSTIPNYVNWIRKSDKLLTPLKEVQNRIEVIEEESDLNRQMLISETKLSPTKIADFKVLIGRSWKEQARVQWLFSKYQAVEDLTGNTDIMLQFIGQRTFFEKAKMMFTDKYHEHIYGIEKMGGQTGRWEDDTFFSKIIDSKPSKITHKTALEVISHSIEYLKSNGQLPNLILISPEYSYAEQGLLDNEKFTPSNQTDESDDTPHFMRIGTFDSIPIYTSFSPLLEKHVLVADFPKAFKLRLKTNPEWFEDKLKVEVKEVTADEAKARLRKEPEKWSVTSNQTALDEESALAHIKTSVTIEIGSTLDFVVQDKKAFVFGHIIADIES